MNTQPSADRGAGSERLRGLFESCLELLPDARDAFLHSQSATDDERRSVAALLAADARTEDVFERPATAWAERLQPRSGGSEALVGSRVGDFNILELLGQGGSAVVFRAEREVGGARQTVALKLLRSGLFSSEAQRRFRRELAILAQLAHPNIAHLIDAGISEAGIPYIATELVEGSTLTVFAQSRSLDLPARLRLLAELARAVDAAHRALIVHRDLKPSNVMVNVDGQIKVLDFGIAKVLGDGEDTATQHISLTPGYAAPEQYRRGPVTTATDVYALGVVAAELLLEGRLGVDGAVPRDDEHAERTRRRWQQLDVDLATILRTALAAEPEQRYATARHLADDIERFARQEPISARAPSRWYRASKFIARHRLAVLAVGAFVLALLAALGSALWQARAAREQAARADSLRDFMFDAFADAEPSVPRNGPASVLDAVRRAIAGTGGTQGDPRARLELRARLAQVLQAQGDVKGARQLLAECLQEARATLGDDDALSLEIAQLVASNALLGGEFAAARAQIDQLLARLGDGHRELRIKLLSLSAVVATKLRERDRAMSDGRQAVALAREFGDPRLLRTTLNDFGVVLLSTDALPETIAVYEEVLARNRQLFGEQHQKVATAEAALSRAYRRQGDLPKAERAARAALAIDRAIYSGDDWRTAVHLNALMVILRTRGDLSGALAAAEEALRIDRATLGDEHPETVNAQYGVGTLRMLLEAWSDALPPLRAALQGSEQRFGAEHHETALTRANFGYALAMSGELRAGTVELERAIADLEALADPDADMLSVALEKRVRLALDGGDGGTALLWIDRLARLPGASTTAASAGPGKVEMLRGAALLQLQRGDEATAALQRAGVELATAKSDGALLRAEHALLCASAALGRGEISNGVTLLATARERLRGLPFVPGRLKALQAKLEKQTADG